MDYLSKIVNSFLLLGACSLPPQQYSQHQKQSTTFKIIGTPSPNYQKNSELLQEQQQSSSEPAPVCPVGMSNIEGLFCIDKYEASIVDQTSGDYASAHYIASNEGIQNNEWQYTFFKNLAIPPDKLKQLLQEKQLLSMPPRAAETYQGFKPKAVSERPVLSPASYLSRMIAEQACTNAGKRLCTRKEWYKACVGPEGPSPYIKEEGKDKGKEIFPVAYPYGASYEKGKCNIGLQVNRWPPGLLGRKNNHEMLDPRIGTLHGKDGFPMRRATTAFSDCTNSYGVYDMVGNVHEIVADIYKAKRGPKQRAVFVGSHYARSAKESCAEATNGHWFGYSDYSIGFRCCKDIQ